MNKISKQHFWTWFSRHQCELLALSQKPKKEIAFWLNELSTHLRALHKFLGYTLEWLPENKMKFTFSVNGRARQFAQVESLVNLAPQIKGWIFRALEGPRPVHFLLENEILKAGVDPEEFKFAFADNDEFTGIIVYHPLCTTSNSKQMCRLATGVVFNLLGERTFGEDIDYVDVDNLSCADPTGLADLESLPAALALRQSLAFVDPEGYLVMK